MVIPKFPVAWYICFFDKQVAASKFKSKGVRKHERRKDMRAQKKKDIKKPKGCHNRTSIQKEEWRNRIGFVFFWKSKKTDWIKLCFYVPTDHHPSLENLGSFCYLLVEVIFCEAYDYILKCKFLLILGSKLSHMRFLSPQIKCDLVD